MNIKNLSSKFVFRKLKLSDYNRFRKLFYSCFEKKISYNFFKWRYFSDRYSFCFGVFFKNDLIANIGMKSIYLNNKNYNITFSRHSSMVLEQFRGMGIFSKLSMVVQKKISSKIAFLLMWPNKKNYSNFGFSHDHIIWQKFYLYHMINPVFLIKKTLDYDISKLIKFKKFMFNDQLIKKDFKYFKTKYLLYKKKDYLINHFRMKNLDSFFILKKNFGKENMNYALLDHFGSKTIKNRHKKFLLNEKSIIFWSTKKIYKKNCKFVDQINFKIASIGKFKKITKNFNSLINDLMIGDTDSFININ